MGHMLLVVIVIPFILAVVCYWAVMTVANKFMSESKANNINPNISQEEKLKMFWKQGFFSKIVVIFVLLFSSIPALFQILRSKKNTIEK